MDGRNVYIETSIISYLTARPSSDLLAAARQKATIDWWDTQRSRFALFASDIVIEEAGRGDDIAVVKRLEALAGIPLLAMTDQVVAFSRALIESRALPRNAIGDSLHIALSAVHGIDYLLTWNTVILTTPKRSRLSAEFAWKKDLSTRRYVHLKNSWGHSNMTDEIIRELWTIKDTIANEYGCDVDALVDYLRAKGHDRRRLVVDLRSIKQTTDERIQGDPNHASSI